MKKMNGRENMYETPQNRIRRYREMTEAFVRDQMQRRGVWFNGNEYETQTDRLLRRVRAMEAHLRDVEERYAGLENRLNLHAAKIVFEAHSSTSDEPEGDYWFDAKAENDAAGPSAEELDAKEMEE